MILSAAFLALIAALPTLGTPSPSQPRAYTTSRRAASGVITPEIKVQVDQLLRNNTVPGYALAIVRLGDNGGVEFGTWGNRTEDGDAVGSDTIFGIASCSKAFLATSMGILIDDFASGRNVTTLPDGVSELDWDTKLESLLPGQWGLMDDWASQKTAIKDALSHSTGLSRHDYSYSRHDTIESIVKRLHLLRPAFELREQWNYNNQMFVTISAVIERYSNMTYPEFATSRVLTPLNMSSSSFSPSAADATGRFSQSWSSTARRVPTWFNDEESHVFAGPGGLLTSVEDMAKWVTLLLGGAEGTISNTTYEVPQIPRAVGTFPVKTYGMGWAQDALLGHPIVWHNGGIPGVSSLVTLFPEDKFGIVQLANADSKDLVNLQVMGTLASAVLGGQFEQSGLDAILRQFTEFLTGNTTAPARPVESSNSTSLEALAGTYTDAAYGTFTLCAPTTPSSDCASVLAAFSAVNPNIIQSNSLYAVWPRVWSEHLELARNADGSFESIPTSLFSQGFGKDKSPFQLPSPDGSYVVFDVDDQKKVTGFGLIGLEGLVLKRQRTGKTIEEKADVWFRRVD